MATYHFTWLGSRRAAKNNVSEKGVWLDTAMSRGLPVPNGGILLDDFYLLCLQEKVAIEATNMVIVPDAGALHQLLFTAVRFPQLEKLCVVRPLSARPAPPHVDIQMNHAQTLATVLAEVWTAVLPAGPQARRDVLIQEMVSAKITGTAVTRAVETEDQVTTNEGTTNLPRLGRWGKTDPKQPAYGQRLQKLLDGVRRTFGQSGWRVSWADDGRICWLIQVESLS